MSDAPMLLARDIAKSFGHVQALRGADLEVHAGEVVGLVGDNGAGKSTLVKVISGSLQPDAGEILFRGEPIRVPNAVAARRLGIETVYQDLALAPDLDAVANLFLGREVRHRGPLRPFGVLDRRAMRRRAAELFGELGVALPSLAQPVGALSGGQRQGVAVARAGAWATRVILMDEPTAALGAVQTEQVAKLIRRISGRGLGVVLISHNLPEVLELADRIEVMRLGRRVAQIPAGKASTEMLVRAMTGLGAESAP